MTGRRRTPEVIDWSEAGELFADEQLDRSPGRGARRACTRPRWRPRCGACRSAAGGCWPRRSRTNGWPTCSRSSPRKSRYGSSRGSTRSAWPGCSTRWRPTTPPTCSVSSPPPGRPSCSARWTPRRPSPSGGCSSTSPTPPAALMTPEPVILAPHATVAEALARIRDPDLPVPLAAQVFVCQSAARDADRPLPGRGRGPAPAARGARQAAGALPRRGVGSDRGRRKRPRGGRAARRLRRRRAAGDRPREAAARRGYDRRRARPHAPGRLARRRA